MLSWRRSDSAARRASTHSASAPPLPANHPKPQDATATAPPRPPDRTARKPVTGSTRIELRYDGAIQGDVDDNALGRNEEVAGGGEVLYVYGLYEHSVFASRSGAHHPTLLSHLAG